MFRTSMKKHNSIFTYNYETAGVGPMRTNLLIIIPILMVFGGWASFAPLESAAIASGEVVLNQEKKTIQHLEGGLVDNILISEGQSIEKGAPILIIRDVKQRSQINRLYERLAALRALQARLVAERDEATAPDFATLHDDIDLPKEQLESLVTMQTKLFNSRRKAFETKVKLIETRKLSAKEEIEGISHQLKATQARLSLNRSEHKNVKHLYEKKLATSSRVMQLEQEAVQFDGEIGSLKASIARLKQSMAAADIEIIDLRTDNRNRVMEELQSTELNLQELIHQVNETADQLERTVVKAPTSGTVMDLKVHTRGAVVQPGERLLDIVPTDDRLIVEARLNPNDIDLVSAGTSTKVLLSAYKSKKVPKLNGEVLSVSADSLLDDTTGERYFLARILVDDSILKDLNANVALYPGMPVQTFFITGSRTVADYALSPVLDATYRAFREE